MNNFRQKIEEQLIKRKAEGLYRELRDYSHLVDFSSNDYLGLSGLAQNDNTKESGATGSRMISGNSIATEKLEKNIADYHGYEEALLFNSGYTANLGLLSTLPQRGDTILYDELIHASIRDGIKLSNAQSFSFLHNDLKSLQEKLNKGKGNIFVIVESIYSMDGDSPDLLELSKLCKLFNANLVVDEAHAIGIVGIKGEGLVALLNLQYDVLCTVVTFGKALGCHGAAVLCSPTIKEYLVNFCRSFIYTTAPSPHTVFTIKKHYEALAMRNLMEDSSQELKKLFVNELSSHYQLNYGRFGNIVSVFIEGNGAVKAVANQLEKNGFFVKAILSPTVPKGKERLRFCFHSFNTEEELGRVITILKNIKG